MTDIEETAARLRETLTDAELIELRNQLQPRFTVSEVRFPDTPVRAAVLCRNAQDTFAFLQYIVNRGLSASIKRTVKGLNITFGVNELEAQALVDNFTRENP